MTNRRGVILLFVLVTLLTLSASAQQTNSNWVSTGDFQQHKFWDRQNKILFAAHAGLAATDFALTHRNLANGGKELNPIARPFTDMGTPGEVAFFAGSTAASLGVTYLLHKTHHHSMERWVARYGVADSAAGVAFNLAQGSPSSPRPATPQLGIRIQLTR
jgi:hypothetical protein